MFHDKGTQGNPWNQSFDVFPLQGLLCSSRLATIVGGHRSPSRRFFKESRDHPSLLPDVRRMRLKIKRRRAGSDTRWPAGVPEEVFFQNNYSQSEKWTKTAPANFVCSHDANSLA